MGAPEMKSERETMTFKQDPTANNSGRVPAEINYCTVHMNAMIAKV